MRGETADVVIQCIVDAMQATTQVEPATHLRGQLGADSLDFCEITLRLEESFPDVRITEAEADSWETVSDVIATVERGTHAS